MTMKLIYIGVMKELPVTNAFFATTFDTIENMLAQASVAKYTYVRTILLNQINNSKLNCCCR